jgi:hypothetical protein
MYVPAVFYPSGATQWVGGWVDRRAAAAAGLMLHGDVLLAAWTCCHVFCGGSTRLVAGALMLSHWERIARGGTHPPGVVRCKKTVPGSRVVMLPLMLPTGK